MAVDTVSKRFSMMNLGTGFVRVPLPDGTVGAKDRLRLLALYSGIADTEGGGGGAQPTRGNLCGGHMRLSGGLL